MLYDPDPARRVCNTWVRLEDTFKLSDGPVALDNAVIVAEARHCISVLTV